MADKVYSIDINAPLQKVWDEITSTDRVQGHMFNCVLSTNRPGQAYLWHNAARKNVFVRGSIVDAAPPNSETPGHARFVQTFQFTTMQDPESLVEWHLTELQPGLTRVKVVHSKLDPGGKTIKSIDGGWPSILAALRALCENGKLPLAKRLQLAMMGAMSFALPKATRMEHFVSAPHR